MKVGIIGCGFVLDKYMATWSKHPGLEIAGVSDLDPARVEAVSKHYGLHDYESNEALLADPEVDIVANFTSIQSHYEVIKAALDAGKHVYSEKPLVTKMAEAHELFALAEKHGLRLSCAPSIALGATARAMWKAVADGAIGDARLAYAEFDTSPLYLTGPDASNSPREPGSFPFLHEHYTITASGAPFPFLHEFMMGCTYEHAGYHLSWMCAIFGPVKSVTAFSKQIMPDKTDRELEIPNTPDFSVATLDFESGAVGRITCSISGANDHRMRIIGTHGMLHAHNYSNYHCPVYLEPFNRLTIKARYFRGTDTNWLLNKLFGIGGRSLPLAKMPPPGSEHLVEHSSPWWDPRADLGTLRRRIMGTQDKVIGIVELADAIEKDRPQFPSHAFSAHLTELTLAIQAAGTVSRTHELETRFDRLDLPAALRDTGVDYNDYRRPKWLARTLEQVLERK